MRLALRRFAIAAGVLAAAFILPLTELVAFASNSDLYSYTVAMPVLAGLMIWCEREELARLRLARAVVGPVALVLLATGLLTALWLGWWGAENWQAQDRLAGYTFSFVLLVAAAGWSLVGPAMFRQLAFPAGLFLMTVPFPVALEEVIVTFLQHGTAPVAEAMFELWGTPVLREGVMLHLPNLPLMVDRPCSGIHSTVVLFITSLVVGRLLLRAGWPRWALVAAVLPIAFWRNGLRVFLLGQLSLDFGRYILDSIIHKRGGIVLFVLSLLPLFALVWLFRRLERRRATRPVRPSA